MDRNSDSTMLINDILCKQVGLISGKFRNNDNFSFHAFSKILSSTRDQPTKFANTNPVNIHNFSSEFVLDDTDGILRSLLAEASTIFHKLQINKGDRTSLLQISRQYRSVIRACLNKLQSTLNETTNNPEATKRYEKHITIFYSIEFIWHLIELLLLDKDSSISVVPSLLEWTKFHFPGPGQMATEILLQQVEIGSEFWSIIKGLVIQGQLDIARALLKLHPKESTTTFKVIDEIFRTMPVFSSRGGLSLQKFRAQRQYWATSVETKLHSGLISTEKSLEEIVKLLIGDNNAWMDVCKSSECWYEHFAGYLFFCQPATKYFELGTFANDWKNKWDGETRQLDEIVLSIMENNMSQVIHASQFLGDNKWFVTHITDLLVHSGQLQISSENNTAHIDMRESFLFDFGTYLMSRESLFEIGLDYLEFSSTEGIGAREVLLTRIPLKNETQAMKIINVARKFGLVNAESEICKVMVKRSLQNERFGNALEWAIRSRENIYVTEVANIFLQRYCSTGEMLCEDLLANIGAKMLAYPRLLFLVQYYDFHRFYSARELSDAARVLVKLLDSNIIPDFFWPSLLADAIPLLEHKEPIIPTEETYRILHHLENDLIPYLDKQKKQQEKAKQDGLNLLNGCPDDLVQMIRLTCARNLSRAVIIENTLVL